MTPDLANPTCPENICQTIINVVDVDNDVDINNIEQNIECNFEVKCDDNQYKDEDGACQDCLECDLTYQREVLACTLTQNRTCEDSVESCGQGRWSESALPFADDCKDCTVCPDGSRVKSKCTNNSDTVCEVIPTSCPDGTYSPNGENGDFDNCIKCGTCVDPQIEQNPCTQIADVVCRDADVPDEEEGPDIVEDIVITVSVLTAAALLTYLGVTIWRKYRKPIRRI